MIIPFLKRIADHKSVISPVSLYLVRMRSFLIDMGQIYDQRAIVFDCIYEVEVYVRTKGAGR